MAIRRGLSEIAITDHMDIYTGLPYDEQMNFDVPGGEQHHMDAVGLYKELCNMKEKYAGQLKVRILSLIHIYVISLIIFGASILIGYLTAWIFRISEERCV